MYSVVQNVTHSSLFRRELLSARLRHRPPLVRHVAPLAVARHSASPSSSAAAAHDPPLVGVGAPAGLPGRAASAAATARQQPRRQVSLFKVTFQVQRSRTWSFSHQGKQQHQRPSGGHERRSSLRQRGRQLELAVEAESVEAAELHEEPNH